MKLEKTDIPAIRQALIGQRKSIRIGRSANSAGFGSGTPIDILADHSAPKLCGQPYLKTTFRKGTFSKTLYTPSSLRVEVGQKWIAEQRKLSALRSRGAL